MGGIHPELVNRSGRGNLETECVSQFPSNDMVSPASEIDSSHDVSARVSSSSSSFWIMPKRFCGWKRLISFLYCLIFTGNINVTHTNLLGAGIQWSL